MYDTQENSLTYCEIQFNRIACKYIPRRKETDEFSGKQIQNNASELQAQDILDISHTNRNFVRKLERSNRTITEFCTNLQGNRQAFEMSIV